MSNEIQVAGAASATVYAVLEVLESPVYTPGFLYNQALTAFEAEVNANWTSSKYCISATEQGTTDLYQANFPTAITAEGIFKVRYYTQGGGSPAVGDTLLKEDTINWTGSQIYDPDNKSLGNVPSPSGLAGHVSSGTVVLTWTLPAGVQGARVYRDGNVIYDSVNATGGNTTTAYTDLTPSVGANHFYWVVSYRAGAQSGQSNQINIPISFTGSPSVTVPPTINSGS